MCSGLFGASTTKGDQSVSTSRNPVGRAPISVVEGRQCSGAGPPERTIADINAAGVDAEELELELIDYGAEEVSADEDALVITGTFESFGQLQSKLEADGMEIVESGLERVPNTTKELDSEATAEVEKLIERLEEDDDVQNVFHTMSSSTDAEA